MGDEGSDEGGDDRQGGDAELAALSCLSLGEASWGRPNGKGILVMFCALVEQI